MSRGSPTPVNARGGGCPPGGATATCCLARKGDHEIRGRQFNRVFMAYGRSNAWFTADPVSAANLPSGVTWEAYYYDSRYSYRLAYTTNGPGAAGGFDGKITVTLRCKATIHPIPPTLKASAPELFTDLTAADITAAFTDWNAAVQDHWTNRNYTVEVGAPDCPGKFKMEFVLVEDAANSHITFSVLKMKGTHTATSPLTPTTQRDLSILERSNTIKFNLGDSRGTLVFAHEFGHYMGWGDEYLEVTGRNMPNPDNPTAGPVLYEERGGTNKKLRVAIRIKNPTRKFRDANGKDLEEYDITVPGRLNWLMSSMVPPQTHLPRFVYTIVHDFIERYNADWYGGGNQAYCIDVTATP